MFPGTGELGYSPGEHREDLRRASGGIERRDRSKLEDSLPNGPVEQR